MHELSLAQNIIKIIEEETADNKDRKVDKVVLNIGQLAGVVIESLTFCFEVSIEETELEGAKLEINKIPLKCKCKDCDTEFSPRGYVFLCPQCKSHKYEILQGREMEIEQIILGD